MYSCACSQDVGIETEESKEASAKARIAGRNEDAAPPPISLADAAMLPNVMGYALAFGFFKLTNYAMFFQLPLILSQNFDSATANIISALYSFGMMPGGV